LRRGGATIPLGAAATSLPYRVPTSEVARALVLAVRANFKFFLRFADQTKHALICQRCHLLKISGDERFKL
jgi:hypothetical protein